VKNIAENSRNTGLADARRMDPYRPLKAFRKESEAMGKAMPANQNPDYENRP
jgi:hypothetical protein